MQVPSLTTIATANVTAVNDLYGRSASRDYRLERNIREASSQANQLPSLPRRETRGLGPWGFMPPSSPFLLDCNAMCYGRESARDLRFPFAFPIIRVWLRGAISRPSYGPRSDKTGSYLRSGFRFPTADSVLHATTFRERTNFGNAYKTLLHRNRLYNLTEFDSSAFYRYNTISMTDLKS